MKKLTENGFHTLRGYQMIDQNKGELTPALEDYLEMVYRLCMEDHYTRINKLSKSLHVRPSSASKMVAKLVELGFLEYDNLDCIRLTEKGASTGTYLLERHRIVEGFFALIGSNNPLKEAELVEHMLSPATVFSLKGLVDFFDQHQEVYQQFCSFNGGSIKKKNSEAD